jgi:hypothetical protein
MRNRTMKFPSGLAAIAVAVTVFLGGLLGHFIGTPKSFLLIVIAMLVWLTSGWFFGGWRSVLVGVSALTAALTASEGVYVIAVMFSCAAFLLLYADILPRGQHSDRLPQKI